MSRSKRESGADEPRDSYEIHRDEARDSPGIQPQKLPKLPLAVDMQKEIEEWLYQYLISHVLVDRVTATRAAANAAKKVAESLDVDLSYGVLPLPRASNKQP